MSRAGIARLTWREQIAPRRAVPALRSGDARRVAHAHNHSDDGDGGGRNTLGQVLMRVPDELRAE